VELYRERANSVADLVSRAGFVFHDEVTYDPASVAEVLAKEGVGARLEAAAERLAGLSSFDPATLERELRALAEAEGVGFGKLAQPIRVAVTGGRVSPPIFGTLALVGREQVVERLRQALAKFCRPGGREA
jgi:glutamyl-tRNA synthetase